MTTELRKNSQRLRFEYWVDGVLLGISDYSIRTDGAVIIPHTEIDPAHGGQGHGTTMVRRVLDVLRSEGTNVVPACPFVAAFIDDHPDYADMVT